ncbi:MAG: Panacea domain-containing protein [Saprospiraceae bacterium]
MKYFDFHKSVQCLVYIAQQLGVDEVNKMKTLKLIWLADRIHLLKYGRPITCASYLAMKNGPVASEIRDILELNSAFSDQRRSYINEFILTVPKSYNYSVTGSIDLDEFSDSDLDCLDIILAHFGKLDEFQLSDLSHEYPEWAKFEAQLEAGEIKAHKMDLMDFFNTSGNIDPIFNVENAELSKELFREYDEISVLHYLTNNANFADKGT